MALDALSYAAPSRIRALLCTLGRIKRSRFQSFVERLQDSNVVRLGDVTPDSRSNRTMFSPQGFPSGQIVYDFTNSFDREHEYLESFELFRRTFLVLAIADHNEENDAESLIKQVEELKFLYPHALYHAGLIFDSPTATTFIDHSKNERPILIPVPSKRQSRTTSIRTLMCDITAVILSELGGFAKSLQDLSTIDSPLSPESIGAAGGAKDHRMSMPVGTGSATPNIGISGSVNKRMSMAAFGSGSVSERARNKGKGRVEIAIAGLYLLAGRVPDALKEFLEGANIAKANNDHLWHGKALEGIGVCLIILSYLKIDFQIPQIPYPTAESTKSSKPPPALSKPSTPVPNPFENPTSGSSTPEQLLELIPELLNTILNLYIRSSNFPGESIPQIIYSETVLRVSKLLASIHLANGLNEAALSSVVLGKSVQSTGIKKGLPSKTVIAETVMKAYPFPLEVLTVLDATKVLGGIASVLGAIGLKRRKALVTRELVRILIPGLIQARVIGAAEVGIHPAAGLSTITGNGPGGSPLDLGEGDVESGVMELLEDLCRSYGILPGQKMGSEAKNLEVEAPEALRINSATADVLAEQEIRSFGWSALKIHVLRNCTALCEALPDFQGVLKFTTQLLRTADGELTKEEQIRLSTTISRTVGAARKLGLSGVEADYWDQFLLRDIEVIESDMWRPPIPHARSELLDAEDTSAVVTIEADKNPFIYNPFFKEATIAAAETLLVCGETAEFRVTLQNPFEFDVDIESITLDTTGAEVDVQTVGLVIQPYRTCQISIFATPKDRGAVSVTGCRIKVFGCKEKSFPIFTEGLDRREKDIKTKRFGLKATEPKYERPASAISATGRSSLRPLVPLHPIPKTLSLTVVESQPLLVVKTTSLSQSALMVLEGEKRIFEITFKNLSGTEVDLLMFSFGDSTTARIQQALAEKGNSPAEMYELELMLARKRAFVWRREGENRDGSKKQIEDKGENAESGDVNGVAEKAEEKIVYVPAHGTATFEIEVLGKAGLTHGSIQADYSHLGVSTPETERFYTRQVIFPVTVTVNASIELVRVDFVPFGTDVQFGPSTSVDENGVESNGGGGKDHKGQFKELFRRMGLRNSPGEHCLMLIDLRNVWPQSLNVKLFVRDSPEEAGQKDEESWEGAFHAEDVLQAGHTTRMILPIKRIFLPNPTAPIPSVSASQRQFVVSTTKLTVEQERQGREAFWYREEVLKNIRGQWEELETGRKGEVELRGIRLSARMVETVRVEDVGINIEVKEEGSDETKARKIGPSKYLVGTDTFLTLSTTLTNRTSHTIFPLLRLLPSLKNQAPSLALDLTRKFAFNGLLQQSLKSLKAGEERVVEIGFVVLCKGEFDVSASVEEIKTDGVFDSAAPGELGADGIPVDVVGKMAGRRTWVAREICGIVARDLE